jgi:hypothetical protein
VKILEAATIKLFLVHGTPNGLRTAEISNWSGKAVAAPRNELTSLLSRDELSSPGIYILTGEDADSNDKSIYIGEAENVATRLKTHSGKDFWNAATVFVSKDENLTKSHIRYLEGKLIKLAVDTSTSVLVNSTSSGAKLPESDAAEMDIFLQKVLQLLPVLGVNDLSMSVEAPSREEDTLYCTIKGLTAKGKRTSGGFTVFAGSQAVLEHRPSAVHAKKRREELVEKGLLKPMDNYLEFTKDIEFGSPSRAATIVRGGASNGLTAWRDSKGVQLRDLENN